jgi:hypothetical protein
LYVKYVTCASAKRDDQNSAKLRICFIRVYVFAFVATFNTVFCFFLANQTSLGGYRSSAPIRAVPCKTFANAVSLDGLPITNAQQRARTSIRKHYPPVHQRNLLVRARSIWTDFLYLSVNSSRANANSCLDISNLVKMEDGIFE